MILNTGQNYQGPQEVLWFFYKIQGDVAEEVEPATEEGIEGPLNCFFKTMGLGFRLAHPILPFFNSTNYGECHAALADARFRDNLDGAGNCCMRSCVPLANSPSTSARGLFHRRWPQTQGDFVSVMPKPDGKPGVCFSSGQGKCHGFSS